MVLFFFSPDLPDGRWKGKSRAFFRGFGMIAGLAPNKK